MDSLLAALGTSVTTFAATNIDDLCLLTLFFARRVPPRQIVAGQYVGFAAIVVLSLVGAWAALAIPHRWIRLLGLLPLAIGVREMLKPGGSSDTQTDTKYFSVISIALVTLANGADNVGVYVPFFVVSRARLWIILSVYAVMVGTWCAVARWLGTHPLVLRWVDRWGHRAVPLVFICLGIYILIS